MNGVLIRGALLWVPGNDPLEYNDSLKNKCAVYPRSSQVIGTDQDGEDDVQELLQAAGPEKEKLQIVVWIHGDQAVAEKVALPEILLTPGNLQCNPLPLDF